MSLSHGKLGYEELEEVFSDAFHQAAYGKGAERHANDLPFHEQRMQTISKTLESDKGMAFQVIKKLTEGLQLDHDRREKELLGAIVYLAGIVIYHRKGHTSAAEPFDVLDTIDPDFSDSFAAHCEGYGMGPASAADTGQAAALDADRAVSVELMQRVWANLYFDEEGAEFTFQSTLNDVVDWLTKNNAVPPLVETEKGLRCPSIPAPNSDEHVAVALDKLRAALRQKEGGQ